MVKKTPSEISQRAMDRAEKKRILADLKLARREEKERQIELNRERRRVKAKEVAERKSKRAAFKSEVCEYFTSNDTTLEATGKKFGITRERVRQILKAAGIDERFRWAAVRAKHIAEVKDRAAADYHSGMTIEEVSSKYGLALSDWRSIPHDARTAHLARFWNSIEKGEHWIEKDSGNARRIGRKYLRVLGRSAQVHHIVWELVHGKKPGGWLINKCGVKHCVNPDHWADLTAKEVAAQRNRRKHPPSLQVVKEIRESSLSRRELAAKYDRSYATIARIQSGGYSRIITNDQIRAVLALKGTMKQKEISERTGVTRTTVCQIVNGNLVEAPDREV